MKQIKKALSIALCLMLVLSALPFALTASAESETVEIAFDSNFYDASNTAYNTINPAVEAYIDKSQTSNVNSWDGNRLINATYPSEGQVVFKFDAGDGKLITAPSFSWGGRAIQDTASRLDVYVSTSNNASAWAHLGGIGQDSNIYEVNNNEDSPYTHDLSDYVGSGVSTVYIKVVMYRTKGTYTYLDNIKMVYTAIDDASEEYSLDLTGANLTADVPVDSANNGTPGALVGDYLVAEASSNYDYRQKAQAGNYAPSIISESRGSETNLVFKFDMGEGYLLKGLQLTWKCRAINNNASYAILYYSNSLNGTWTQISGIGMDKFGKNNTNIGSGDETLDLTDDLGNGIQTLYLKVSMINKSTSDSHAAFAGFKLNGVKIPGTHNNTAVTSIKNPELGGELMVGETASFSALANPFWLADRSVTVTSSDSSVLSVSGSDGNYTVTGVAPGTATVTLTRDNFSKTYDYSIVAAWIQDDYDDTITVTAANEVDSTKFYEIESETFTAPMAKEAGAAVKLEDVSFEDFLDVGSNFVRANVAWGQTGTDAASFDVYVDSVADANKVATLWAAPYGSSITAQKASSYLDNVITGTHDIYVVFNTPGSALYDIAFGNMSGGYSDEYTMYFGDPASTTYCEPVLWDVHMINYSGHRDNNGNVVRPAGSDAPAVSIFRVDASEGNYLTGVNWKFSGRVIGDAKVTPGVITIQASTDMKNWTDISSISSKGDATYNSWDINNQTETAVSNGAETVYIKVIIKAYDNFASSWSMMQGIYLKPVEAAIDGNFEGDTNVDEQVNILDLVRFKKASAGVETTIANTAYFAGMNNLVNDLIYTRKTLLGVDFDVDRSRYEEVAADTAPAPDDASETPTIFDALDLAPTSNEDAPAEINSKRIQYCVDNYGFAKLQAGATYYLDAPIDLDTNGASIICDDADKRAELVMVNSTWYVVNMNKAGNKLQNLIINLGGCYTAKTHLDAATVQINGATNAVVDNCLIMSDYDPERKDVVFGTEDQYMSTSCGIYVFSSASNTQITNSTIRNNYYGVIFHSSLTKDMNNSMDNCVVTYNRGDGITFSGYAKVTNSTISYNGYDCQNAPEGKTDPIPGAGVYSEGNSNGLLLDNCQIFRNNGFNVDVNGTSSAVITNNTMYDPGWVSFPEAEDYQTVGYRNGISLQLTGLINSTVTGNVVKNELVDNRLDKCYGHLTFGNDFNGYFGFNHTGTWNSESMVYENGTPFADLPNGGASIVACVIASGCANNTITGNQFIAHPVDNTSAGVVGYGLFIDFSIGDTNTINNNSTVGSTHGLVDVSGNYANADSVVEG